MEDEFNAKLSQMEERVVRRVKNEMFMVRRNIEDFALQQMTGMMGFEYPQEPYAEFVEKFLKLYSVEDIPASDPRLLGHSTTRQNANDFAHLQMHSSKTTIARSIG